MITLTQQAIKTDETTVDYFAESVNTVLLCRRFHPRQCYDVASGHSLIMTSFSPRSLLWRRFRRYCYITSL